MRTNQFDGEVARRYDRDEAEMFSPAAIDPAVELLAGLAAGGAACEFAIGTGRSREISRPPGCRGSSGSSTSSSTRCRT